MQLEGFRSLTQWLEDSLGWVPEWIVGAVALAFATVVALFVHAALRFVVRRVLSRFAFSVMLLERTKGPARVAFIILAWRLVLPALPFSDHAFEILDHGLQLALIGLLGWIAYRALDLAAALYLRRFRLDTEDNLLARKHVTQIRILRRAVASLIVVVTIATALMSFESVRQYGVSLFASAGVAGLIVGLASRPLLTNLIAGVQLAVTQPIRIDDAVVVENEWGWIEEITATYVVVRLWDWRRLIVPLSYFIEKPFQNWTREGSAIIGSVLLYLDYSAPIDRLRQEFETVVRKSKLWDGEVLNMQVTDAKPGTIEVRALVSARSAPAAWDLRCEVREKLIDFLQREVPHALPRTRAEVEVVGAPSLMGPEPPVERRTAPSAPSRESARAI